jgi:hypothetical protein
VSVAFDGGRAFFRSVPAAHRMMGYRTLHYELVPG